MANYTVFRMVAIKVEADSRKEAVKLTNVQFYSLYCTALGGAYADKLTTSKLISAVKTKGNR